MTSTPPSSSTSLPSNSSKSRKPKHIPAQLSIPNSLPPPVNSNSHSAPLPTVPLRTVSDPPPTTPSSFSKPTINRVSTEQPKSAGHVGKNVKFGFGRHAEDGDRARRGSGKKPEEKRKEGEGVSHADGTHHHARHPHETHINVHTECGRHGDDWLFGGWNVGEVVKRVFSGGKKE